MTESLELWKEQAPQLREYQEQIYQKAKEQNYLVVIPTGLGKTFIAAKLAAHMLQNYPEHGVIILAPTRPLINQHHESLEKVLAIKEEKLYILSGKVRPSKRKGIYLTSEQTVFLMTPQTLWNDLEARRLGLKHISLIVFDEAHRARGKYAYCKVAEKYRTQNERGRVLALTASPGSSKEKIQEVCSNLHIPFENIEYRDKRSNSVKKYTHETEVRQIGVEMGDQMRQIYRLLKEVKHDTILNLIEKHLEYDPRTKTNPTYYYMGTIIGMQRKLQGALRQKNRNPRLVRTLLSISARALKVFHLIDNLESQGLAIVYKSMKKAVDKIVKGTASFADKYLYQDRRVKRIYQFLHEEYGGGTDPALLRKKFRHPKMEKLKKIVARQMGQSTDSRILVFTKLRSTVKILTSILEEVPSVSPKKFVGQSTKSKRDKGMSQKQQIQTLEQFKEGIYNVLIATSVAEEGLDIAECNMVVFYDNSASEIKLIQRMGRTGRSGKGKVIILYTKDTSDERYLKLARYKKGHMRKNLGGGKENHRDLRVCGPKKNNPVPAQKDHKPPQKVKRKQRTREKKTNRGKEKKSSTEICKPTASGPTVYVRPHLESKLKYDLQGLIPKHYRTIRALESGLYDLFFPENNTGIDIFSLKKFLRATTSFSESRQLVKKAKKVSTYLVCVDLIGVKKQIKAKLGKKVIAYRNRFQFQLVLFGSLQTLKRKILNL